MVPLCRFKTVLTLERSTNGLRLIDFRAGPFDFWGVAGVTVWKNILQAYLY